MVSGSSLGPRGHILATSSLTRILRVTLILSTQVHPVGVGPEGCVLLSLLRNMPQGLGRKNPVLWGLKSVGRVYGKGEEGMRVHESSEQPHQMPFLPTSGGWSPRGEGQVLLSEVAREAVSAMFINWHLKCQMIFLREFCLLFCCSFVTARCWEEAMLSFPC